jgi:hypothetical protein
MNFTKEELHTSLSYLAHLFERDDIKVRGFDMDVTAKMVGETTLDHSNHRSHCGTVACIGGWLWLLSKESPSENGEYPAEAHIRATEFVNDAKPSDESNLYELFYPRRVARWSEISPKEAAAAIRNYITIGHPQWHMVVDSENIADF